MTDLECDPDQLYVAAARLCGVADSLGAVTVRMPAADAALWGPLGRASGAEARYARLAMAIRQHADEAGRFCDRAADALRRAAEAYRATELANAAAFPAGAP